MTFPRAMDSFDSNDMAIPELKLIQNVGGDCAKAAGAKPGDLFISLTDEIIDGKTGLDAIIADIKKTRTYWGRTEIEDAPPECASMDATSMISIDGQDCNACEKRCDTPGLIDSSERRGLCLVNYILLLINLADNMPLMVRAGGISTKPVRELITQLRLNKELKGEIHKAKIHLTGVPKQSAAGDAFAFHFRATGMIADDVQAEELKLLSGQILGVNLLPIGQEPSTAEHPPVPPTEPIQQEPISLQATTEEVPPQPSAASIPAQPSATPAKAPAEEIDLLF